MQKLKKKVKEFIEGLYFEIDDADLECLTDEVEIIYFMKDIFVEKFKQLTA